MQYIVMAVLAAISILLINEARWMGRILEKVFRLPRDSFYGRSEKHAKLVAVFKWPFLLALLGLAIPTLWSFDFLVTFIAGFAIGWRDFRRQEPKLIESEELWEG